MESCTNSSVVLRIKILSRSPVPPPAPALAPPALAPPLLVAPALAPPALAPPAWVAPALAPALLALGGGSYSMLYAVAAACALGGAAAVAPIRSVG